jgi:hypothetical protein
MKRVNKTKQFIFFAFILSAFCIVQVHASGWPEVFEPNVLRTLYLEMDPGDWQIVENDLTFEIERPALFWASGEEENKMTVAVRRKSAVPIEPAYGEGGPKISLKIDINQYDPNLIWHGLRKLSLENGDDNNYLTEGIACNLHQMASGPKGYGYDAWRGNWVILIINGHNYGVYFNAEQLDKTFLNNRGLFVYHETWLYQYRGEYDFTLETGWDEYPRSPAVNALCYRPFRNETDPCLMPDVFCGAPSGTELVENLDSWINVHGLLTKAAVNAFVSNPDSLFTHERNSHFLDFSIADGRKRMYFPWDVDASNFQTNTTIYGSATGYQQLIFGNPVLKERYRQIMCDLISGPLNQAKLLAFIDHIEPVLLHAVANDPYNQLDTNTVEGVSEVFDEIRQKLIDRIANVRMQAECPACPNVNLNGVGIVDFNDFALLAGSWLESGSSFAGDINNNGSVDSVDLEIMIQYWLGLCQ